MQERKQKKGHQSHYISIKKEEEKKQINLLLLYRLKKKMYELSETQTKKQKRSIIHNQMIH